jgi:poly(A) polymerase Pap1
VKIDEAQVAFRTRTPTSTPSRTFIPIVKFKWDSISINQIFGQLANELDEVWNELRVTVEIYRLVRNPRVSKPWP